LEDTFIKIWNLVIKEKEQMNKFLAAAVQMNTGKDLDSNLNKAEQFVKEASSRNAIFISFPELVNCFEDTEVMKYKESILGPTVQRFQKVAKENNIWIHCGSIHEEIPDSKKYYNTTFLIGSTGEIVATYRKIHLFDVTLPSGDVICESDTVVPGSQIVVASTQFAKLGLSICYDLRFPELYRLMALMGAEVLMVPAAFMLSTGKDHWEPLLRTRAIENGCYVIAPAQIGKKADKVTTYGKSMIIDPWGDVIARSSDKESVIIAEIDLDFLRHVRLNIPSLTNRRPDVYQNVYEVQK
jgi:predicted amidohydrolase